MIAAQLMNSGIRVKSFSRKVHEFADLINLFDDFYCLDHTSIRANPFIPPHAQISQKDWNSIIASTFSTDFWLTYASGINFSKILEDYHDQNPTALITPTRLIQFISNGQRKQFKRLDIDEKVFNRLSLLVTGKGKDIFETNEYYDFSFYSESNINFDLSLLTNIQASAFISIFLTMLIEYKKLINSTTRDCIIIDDFGDLISEAKST